MTDNTNEYLCPDEKHPISRAVHLGRLAAFYPACRQCDHRDDTGTLSTRQVEQLAETSMRGEPRPLFHDEGAGGVYLNDLAPSTARDIAAAFGVMMRGEGGEERGEGRGESNASALHPSSLIPHPSSLILHPSSLIPHPSRIVLAGDARAITAELVAAAGEGLRWSGCDVIDIGPATAACLAYAIHHLQAAGGVLVGNPGSLPHIVGLQFWSKEPRPLSAGAALKGTVPFSSTIAARRCPRKLGQSPADGSLERLEQLYQAGVDRPARSYGRMSRFQADVPYLAAMSESYHALRPLRVVVDSASQPWMEYLQRLASAVACQIIPSRVARHERSEQIRADSAHFAVCIDGDGETCQIFDEQGRAVSAEQILLLLARGMSLGHMVLEQGTSAATIERLERLGMRVTVSSVRRADMMAAMKAENAILGGGPSGRFWHAVAGVPLPDALMTVTRLLVLLSRGDEPFSAVLDREVPLR